MAISQDASPTVIAVAQLAITVGEPDANRRAAASAVAEAAAAGARLVVLPELCDSGYVFDSADEARGLASPAGDGVTLRQWRSLAGQHRLVIVGGLCELGADGRVYNSAALVDPSGTRAVYRKAHLWDKEKLVFTPGDAPPPVVDTEVGRVAVMICYDLEFPEWVRLAALDGADLIAAPVNWPALSGPAGPLTAGERPAEVVKAQAAAATNGVFVAVADRCRTERGVSWISGSVIVGPDGYPLAGPVLADRSAVLTAACDLPRARDKSLSGDNDLLADRRPELYTWVPDKRVAAANAHWAARFIANGTDYSDFQATMARIGRWDDWCREWGRTGQRYERLAETAEAGQRLVTAGEAWRRAALCWHWGKFVFTDHPQEQRAAHERTVACFRRGAGTLSPPAEPVRIPYAGTTLAAYLRVPPGRRPVVIMIPGLDSVKEELQATAEHLLSRGLAVIAIDGPGQGEAEYELSIEPAYERVTTAVADYLKGRDDIDGDRIGVFGVSLGGYYAARSAAYEPRVRAAVALAGPYRWDLDWDMLPPQTRTSFQHRSGAGSPAEARERAGMLTLEHAAGRITCPLLVVHGGRDRLVPPYHAERLAREAPGAELLMDPDGSHGLTNHAFESRSTIADWLAIHL
jgi:predicted amidohydrolase/dienelactone hydrolase